MPVTINGTTGITTPNLDSVGTVTTSNLVNGTALSFRNKIINGNFDIWQRGTSLTSGTGGRYLADRFTNASIGSTYTASQQSFSNGQTDVPNNPSYFHRTVVSSVAGNGNGCVLQHKVESVKTLAGETATLSFYAKADSNKSMSCEFEQNFGTGGVPLLQIQGLGVQKLNLTSSWQKFTITANIPSIVGKTLGTDNNDMFVVNFWFDAGSDFNARTNSLGQQSGTFDIAQVQLEEGSVATPFENRPIGTELALCQRYYESGYFSQTRSSSTAYEGGFNSFAILKRATPTISYSDKVGNIPRISINTGGADINNLSPYAVSAHNNGIEIRFTNGIPAQGPGIVMYNWTASAEL